MMLALSFIGTIQVMGQVHQENAQIVDIQQSYQKGEINVDEAVLKQFRVLHEPVRSSTGQVVKFEKCATPAFMFLNRHKDRLSDQTLNILKEYEVKKVASSLVQSQESYISPSGKFEIIYYTSGQDSVSQEDNDSNGIPDYVERVAESADSSYRHEVLNIGYPDPIPDGELYRVFIENAGGAYGYTSTSSAYPGGTFIVVNNSFDGFPINTHPDGNTVGAIYATVAHEFKHSIQYIQNNWSGESDLWLEMDATLMEEVVYDDVNEIGRAHV